MKSFKDLDSGDIVYVVTLDNVTREITLDKIVIDLIFDPQIDGKLVIFFEEKNEPLIYVEPEASSHIRTDYPKNKSKSHFSDKESAELYLKGLIEQANEFIARIPKFYDQLWSKDIIFKKGDIIKVVSSDLLLLYDGEGTCYMEDGGKIRADENLLLDSKRPSELERNIFLKRLMKLYGDPKLEEILEKCNYKVIVGELEKNEEI